MLGAELEWWTQMFLYRLLDAAPWLLGGAAVIVGLTRGPARRALLSFIRAVRRQAPTPTLSAEEVVALYARMHELEERVTFAERALIKQLSASQTLLPMPPTSERIVVPPHLLRTPV